MLESTIELGNLLEAASQNDSNSDPLATLTRIAEIVEKETEAYLKMDPDPFDDRHPGRADPACSLGHVLKALFKNDDFMNKLVNNYILHRDNRELSTAACRLLLDIMPGLETSVVFQDTEGLVPRLFQWAESGSEPLRSYSTGLLAAAMEIQDIAANFRDQNSRLVLLMLKRLHELWKEEKADQKFTSPNFRPQDVSETPAASPQTSLVKLQPSASAPAFQYLDEDAITDESLLLNSRNNNKDIKSPNKASSKVRSDSHISPFSSPKHHLLNENSNSSWAEMEPFVIGQHQMFPLTKKMQQRLILQYLTPMGEYQEFLGYVFEHNALNLILHYINLRENSDVRLAFEALKYLAALLCHKKFAVEFISLTGLRRLLEVHRPSIAATGVSMCLYYLAYSEDAMDRVCLLPEYVLTELVNYALWLLECSHESGRCHATMFFGLSFPYQIIIELFDAQDGLRKLFNVISTLEILSVDDQGAILNDDAIFASRQTARHVCVALKRYYETHLAIKADKVRRSRSQGNYMYSVPAYKALKITPEVVRENMEFLLTHLQLGANWEPVDELHKLSGVTLLLQLVAMTLEWNYSGRAETVRSALDVLSVCAIMPKTQLNLCDAVKLPEDSNPVGMSILLGALEGGIISDPDVQRAALNVIINCVCGPTYRLGASCSRVSCGKKKPMMRSAEDMLKKMWHSVQGNNGIMVLLSLLMVKTPITDADSIRALACRALVGLARSESVKQIISKLPIFASGQLQILMKEPVLQDKLKDHRMFIKHALELIEKVSGKSLTVGVESSISKINKADVVAQTKIIYHKKQLLQLIHQHLISQGFPDTAAMLQKEASLPLGPPRLGVPCYTITPKTVSTPLSIKIPVSRTAQSSPSLYTYNHIPCSYPHTPVSTRATPGGSGTPGSSNASTSTAHNVSSVDPLSKPIRVSLVRDAHKPPSLLSDRVVQKTFNRTSALEKSQTGSSYQQSPVMKRQSLQGASTSSPAYSTVQLDNIVTEYLRKQHALCKNPVITCPPFDLFVPHSCPDPKFRNCAPTNFTARIHRRPLFPRFGGVDGSKMDRRLIFSRFRPVRVFKEAENLGRFTCCSFTACDQMIALGTHTGDLKLYSVQTGQEEASYSCHDSALTYCQPSRDGRLILTSSAWLPPLSSLWSMTEQFDMLHSFQEDHYVEFSKLVQDRIVGTKDNIANIYDVSSGQRIMVLKDTEMSNNYTKNRATFSPTDELVLSDGVLWDLLSGKAVHKFDKFNPHISGVFHPNGLEVVANSEIWDLRTFHLLHTVPALDQCHVTFNQQGNIMYGAMHTSGEDEFDLDDEQLDRPFGSSFRTFDATDYSNIATIDVKKNICDLCTDKADCYLTVIENMTGREVISAEAVCRLYEIGRLRDEEDEMDEDEDDDGEDDDMATDDDDDDDDDEDDNDDDEDDDNADNDGEQNDDDDGNNDMGDDSLDSMSDELDDEEDFDDDVLFALGNGL